MLLRAYVIRLADGLVALRDLSSVVTDIHHRFPIHFASAKVSIFGETISHLCKTVVRKKVGVPNVPVSVGLSGTLALNFWLAARIIVPLHRQSIDG